MVIARIQASELVPEGVGSLCVMLGCWVACHRQNSGCFKFATRPDTFADILGLQGDTEVPVIAHIDASAIEKAYATRKDGEMPQWHPFDDWDGFGAGQKLPPFLSKGNKATGGVWVE
jgi:hypothetical protein